MLRLQMMQTLPPGTVPQLLKGTPTSHPIRSKLKAPDHLL
jgi:hypothetical protein